jgi:diamine N-acetyltransferase
MSPLPRNVRPATPDDAAVLGTIGPAAYASEYAHLWNNAAAFGAQLETFSASAFASILQRPDVHAWVAELDGTVVGFLTMVQGSANPITREPNGAEVPRAYLLPGSRRLGLGRMMMEAAIVHARKERLGHLWLDVMDSAAGAIQAYERWGFEHIGERRFGRPVIPELAGMLVFRLAL